jgi:adenylate kinase family enzyme
LPLVSYYRGKGLLKNILGQGSIDDIYKQIEAVVS